MKETLMAKFINISNKENKPLYIDAEQVAHMKEVASKGENAGDVIIDTVHGPGEFIVKSAEYSTSLENIAQKICAAGCTLVQLNADHGLRRNHVERNFVSPGAVNYIASSPNLYDSTTLDVHLCMKGSQFSGALSIDPAQYHKLLQAFLSDKSKKIYDLAASDGYIHSANEAQAYIDVNAIKGIEVDAIQISLTLDAKSGRYTVGTHDKRQENKKRAVIQRRISQEFPHLKNDPNALKRKVAIRQRFEDRQADVDLARKIAAECSGLVEFPAPTPDLETESVLFQVPYAYFVQPERYKNIEIRDDLRNDNPAYHSYDVMLEERQPFSAVMRIAFKSAKERERALHGFFRNCEKSPSQQPALKTGPSPKKYS